MTARQALRTARSVGGWVLPAAGLLCLLLTAAGFVLGARPLVVRTGSMAPGIPVGSVLLAVPTDAAATRTGEVYAVPHPDGRVVVHRLREQGSVQADGSRTLVLRGDANRAADAPVVVRRVLHPVLVLPAAGRWLHVAHLQWSQFWLGAGVGVAATVVVSRRRQEPV